jgi:hypothetical protein
MKLINLLYCLLLCFCFTSCKNKGDIIRDADKMVIYFKTTDTLYKHIDSSKSSIQDFIKVLKGKEEKRICQTWGEIKFYSKDRMLFETGFTIEGGKNGCQFLINEESAWRLTYKTGMYLSETLHYLKNNR